MSKPKITITIDGAAGAGKSTLAQHLANYLNHMHGVKVRLKDDGGWQSLNSDFVELPNYFDADVTINVEQK
jgi:adenylate kinase family enzyme